MEQPTGRGVGRGIPIPEESSGRGRGRGRGSAGGDEASGRNPSISPPRFTFRRNSPPTQADLRHELRGTEEVELLGRNRGYSPTDVDVKRGMELLCVEPKVEKDIRGHSGSEINLVTNYFRVLREEDWGLHQYLVEFNPQVDQTFIRKAILKRNQAVIGHRFIFDGTLLHTPFRLEGDLLEFISDGKKDEDKMTAVTLRYVQSTEFGDPIYIQFYNLILKKCMYGMGLEEVGRGFFDPEKGINFPALNVKLWPGFLTSILHHDVDLLLCVEITHKVLRTETVLTSIMSMRISHRGGNFEDQVNEKFKDTIVLTTYNNATYRIIGVDFAANPTHTFKNRKGEDISYQNYYFDKYEKEITNLEQPLLIGVSTNKNFKTKEEQEQVVLIPEFCLFTGLTDDMRANNSLMRELSTHLHMVPSKRVRTIQGFMERLIGTTQLTTELQEWGLRFETNMIAVPGRVLFKEPVLFATGSEMPNDAEDWTKAFRNQKLLHPESLHKWILIVTHRDADKVPNLIKTMQKVSGPLGFNIAQPEIIKVTDPKAQTYVKAIDGLHSRLQEIQMVFVVLATNAAHVYGAVKRRLAVDFGASSQCFLSKNLTSSGLMSIATKLVVQMTTKIGGEPWSVRVPISGLMVVGFDSYKDTYSVVASISQNFTKYFSTVGKSKLSQNSLIACGDIQKCLDAYKKNNNRLPSRIVIYRAGNITLDSGREDNEVQQILSIVQSMYGHEGVEDLPKLTYMIVSKRVNTRIFADKGNGVLDNPPPGTVLDHTITLKNKYQFFMISSTARQGTVTPCSYHVIYDDSNLQADKLQILTYKLCHMYFNWSGTVSVPAHVQYAHKLAQMTSIAFGGSAARSNLSDLLFYL